MVKTLSSEFYALSPVRSTIWKETFVLNIVETDPPDILPYTHIIHISDSHSHYHKRSEHHKRSIHACEVDRNVNIQLLRLMDTYATVIIVWCRIGSRWMPHGQGPSWFKDYFTESVSYRARIPVFLFRGQFDVSCSFVIGKGLVQQHCFFCWNAQIV